MTSPTVLVLGGSGMLGHKVVQACGPQFDTWFTLRQPADAVPAAWWEIFGSARLIDRVDAMQLDRVVGTIRDLRPAVVVNCVGVVKQRTEASDAITSITINALLPHRVADALREWNGCLVHFGTDCVFDGHRGHYTEADVTNATDLYGRTKALGEVATENALTLRTSMIGRELQQGRSLLEWFRTQNGRSVAGYTQAWWSGVTTNHLAGLVAGLIEGGVPVRGLYQVSSGRISKYELLCRIRDALGISIEVQPDDSVFCDRSLNGERFEIATGYRFPGWSALLRELAEDSTPYEGLLN